MRPVVRALTGLRAVAAAWVVVFHFREEVREIFPAVEPAWFVFHSGSAGVDVFFILSGFIISYTYLDRLSDWRANTAGRFLWFRLARIYPLHFFMLIACAVIILPGPVWTLQPQDLGSLLASGEFYQQLFLVHAWGAVEEGDVAWNYPAWSISSEWFAYLLFPFLALVLSAVRGPAIALAGLAIALMLNSVVYTVVEAAGYRGDITLNRVAFEFSAGCFLFLLWRDRWAFHANWAILTPMIGAVALVVTFASDLAGAFAGIVAAPVYAATIYGLAVRGGIVGRFLESRAMVYAGEASFALYMTHAVVERSFAAHLDVEGLASFGLAGRAGVLALYVFVVLLVAVLSYECIEQPSRNVMRRWSALPRVRLPVRQLGFGRAHSSRR